jgi:hypothetical protein
MFQFRTLSPGCVKYLPILQLPEVIIFIKKFKGWNPDKLVKSRSNGIVKIRYTRRGGFLRERPYIWYAEGTKNRRNAVDRTFYDVVNLCGTFIAVIKYNSHQISSFEKHSICTKGDCCEPHENRYSGF